MIVSREVVFGLPRSVRRRLRLTEFESAAMASNVIPGFVSGALAEFRGAVITWVLSSLVLSRVGCDCMK